MLKAEVQMVEKIVPKDSLDQKMDIKTVLFERGGPSDPWGLVFSNVKRNRRRIYRFPRK
jgi:hypothetical protein